MGGPFDVLEDIGKKVGGGIERSIFETSAFISEVPLAGQFFGFRDPGGPREEAFRRQTGRGHLPGGKTEEDIQDLSDVQKLLLMMGFPTFAEGFQAKAAKGELSQEDVTGLLNFLSLASQGQDVGLLSQLVTGISEAEDPLSAVPDLIDIATQLSETEDVSEEDDLLGFDFEKSLELDLQARQLSLEQQQRQFMRDGILSIIQTFPRNIQAQAMLSFLEQPELREIFLPNPEDLGLNGGAESGGVSSTPPALGAGFTTPIEGKTGGR